MNNADSYTIGKAVTPDRELFPAVYDELVAEGWSEIGDGIYTFVLLSPDGERVLKFASGSGQEATLEAALANQGNPHFPRIFGHLALSNGDYDFAYESEALEPLTDEDELYHLDEDTGEYAEPTFSEWERKWSPDRFFDNPNLFKGRPNGPMKDAVRALLKAQKDHFGRCGWDIHPGNVMVRPSDGSLVLNDLLA